MGNPVGCVVRAKVAVMPRARAGRILPIVEVVSGQHGAVGGVEVQSPYAVGVQKVHKTGRGRSGGCV